MIFTRYYAQTANKPYFIDFTKVAKVPKIEDVCLQLTWSCRAAYFNSSWNKTVTAPTYPSQECGHNLDLFPWARRPASYFNANAV